MRVILTDDVVGLGDIGETVRVRPGYARNFLIPKGMAIETEASNANVIAHKMKQVEAKKRKLRAGADDLAQKVRNLTIESDLRVGSGGKVFGSISSREIAEKLSAQGVEVDRRRIHLHEPIKKTGTHFVKIKLHAEVEAQLKVIVHERAATKEEEEKETMTAKAVIEQRAAEKHAAPAVIEEAAE